MNSQTIRDYLTNDDELERLQQEFDEKVYAMFEEYVAAYNDIAREYGIEIDAATYFKEKL